MENAGSTTFVLLVLDFLAERAGQTKFLAATSPEKTVIVLGDRRFEHESQREAVRQMLVWALAAPAEYILEEATQPIQTPDLADDPFINALTADPLTPEIRAFHDHRNERRQRAFEWLEKNHPDRTKKVDMTAALTGVKTEAGLELDQFEMLGYISEYLSLQGRPVN